jgi:hypothetical protein
MCEICLNACDSCCTSINSGCSRVCGNKWAKIKSNWYCIIFTVVVLGTIGIGSSVANIYKSGKAFTPNEELCPVIEAQTQTTITKEIFTQIHWTYSNPQYRVIQVCPTYNHDANLYVGGHLASRSDKKTFSLTSLNHIYDCHGKTIYNVESANFGQTLINMNGILVSLLVKDPDNNILGYVDSFKFYSESIHIIDYQTNVVAVDMQKNFFKIPWNWVIKVLDPNSTVADYRLLMLLAGQLSFSPQPGHNDTTDLCNEYFAVASIITIVFAALEGFACLLLLCIFIRGICECCVGCLTGTKSWCDDNGGCVCCITPAIACCTACQNKLDGFVYEDLDILKV